MQVLRHDIGDRKKVGTISEAVPHLVLHNLGSPLGRRVANILKFLFPTAKARPTYLWTGQALCSRDCLLSCTPRTSCRHPQVPSPHSSGVPHICPAQPGQPRPGPVQHTCMSQSLERSCHQWCVGQALCSRGCRLTCDKQGRSDNQQTHGDNFLRTLISRCHTVIALGQAQPMAVILQAARLA